MRAALLFTLAFAFLSATTRVVFDAFSDNEVAADVMSFFRFDGMLLGAAVAYLARTPEGLSRYRNYAIYGAMASAVGCIGLYALTGRFLTISHSAWACLCASFMIVLLTGKTTMPLASLFRNEALRSLGKYSYAMYVFQSPLIPILAGVWSVAGIAAQFGMDAKTDVTPTLIYSAGMFFATYSIAIASWHLFEKRLLAFKRFF
jgi:peptidoglycan/LPS O-acetylase OafA/YrhL